MEEDNSINWEQRRYEISKAVIQGYCSNDSNLCKGSYNPKIIVLSIEIADELIKQLKNGNLVVDDIQDEMITIEDTKFRRGDICEIYDIERDKKMFLNREAGFIVKIFGDKNDFSKSFKFGEKIPYESYSEEISEAKNKWLNKMNEAIKLWKK